MENAIRWTTSLVLAWIKSWKTWGPEGGWRKLASSAAVTCILLFTYSCLARKLYISCSSGFCWFSSFLSCFLSVLLLEFNAVLLMLFCFFLLLILLLLWSSARFCPECDLVLLVVVLVVIVVTDAVAIVVAAAGVVVVVVGIVVCCCCCYRRLSLLSSSSYSCCCCCCCCCPCCSVSPGTAVGIEPGTLLPAIGGGVDGGDKVNYSRVASAGFASFREKVCRVNHPRAHLSFPSSSQQ